MYQTLNEFLHIWQNEYDRTQRVMSTLTDQSLSYEVTSEDRTLGRIAWHIVLSVHHIVSRTGLEFEAPSDNEPVPAAAMEMADTYRRVSENFILALKANWSDASLLQLNEVSPG